MRISISKACVALTFLCMTPTTGFAEEKSYVCAINEVYECVTVTGCSRVSLADANVAGIMVLDMEKKQLRSAPIGGEPRVDDIEGLSVTNKAILIHGTGKRQTDRTVSALISLETGNLTAGISTLDSSISLLGNCSPQYERHCREGEVSFRIGATKAVAICPQTCGRSGPAYS